MSKTDLETLDRYFAITGRREKDAALAAALAQISTLQAALQGAEGERDRYKAALGKLKAMLTIPAAEYVPAIPDCWLVIDAALSPQGA